MNINKTHEVRPSRVVFDLDYTWIPQFTHYNPTDSVGHVSEAGA